MKCSTYQGNTMKNCQRAASLTHMLDTVSFSRASRCFWSCIALALLYGTTAIFRLVLWVLFVGAEIYMDDMGDTAMAQYALAFAVGLTSIIASAIAAFVSPYSLIPALVGMVVYILVGIILNTSIRRQFGSDAF